MVGDTDRGKYRRYIKLIIVEPGVATAALEDESHAFTVSIHYENDVIRRVDAEWFRHPTSTCAGAPQALNELVGTAITESPVSLRNDLDAFKNCTHMFDITGVLMAFIWQFTHNNGDASRYYQSIVHDVDQQGFKHAELYCNQKPVLQWTVERHLLVAPEAFAGVSWWKGFAKWLSTRYSAMDLAEIILLQKTVFVSQMRGVDREWFVGKKALEVGHNLNSCFALDQTHAKDSVRLDNHIDYSANDSNMLQFIRL